VAGGNKHGKNTEWTFELLFRTSIEIVGKDVFLALKGYQTINRMVLEMSDSFE
jgi:hypothetical protein